MGLQKRKGIIELPVRAVLTETGAAFCKSNKQALIKINSGTGNDEYGILLQRFSPASLQRMILVDYIAGLDITVHELAPIRQDIQDIGKLIAYSVLYRQFDTIMFQKILANEVVKNWNRKNPLDIIDENIKPQGTAVGLKFNEAVVTNIKDSILKPVQTFISTNPMLKPADKNLQLLLSEKYLNNLRTLTWFIIARFLDKDGYNSLIEEIRSGLMHYLEKARIVEYLSLNVIELASNAENSNLKNEAEKVYRGEVDTHAVLYDKAVRKQVLESLQRKAELVLISWKLSGEGKSRQSLESLQIDIYNKESELLNLFKLSSSVLNLEAGQKKLMDFYKNTLPGESRSDLGLYHLSNLLSACASVNVNMNATINHISGSDLTISSLFVGL